MRRTATNKPKPPSRQRRNSNSYPSVSNTAPTPTHQAPPRSINFAETHFYHPPAPTSAPPRIRNPTTTPMPFSRKRSRSRSSSPERNVRRRYSPPPPPSPPLPPSRSRRQTILLEEEPVPEPSPPKLLFIEEENEQQSFTIPSPTNSSSSDDDDALLYNFTPPSPPPVYEIQSDSDEDEVSVPQQSPPRERSPSPLFTMPSHVVRPSDVYEFSGIPNHQMFRMRNRFAQPNHQHHHYHHIHHLHNVNNSGQRRRPHFLDVQDMPTVVPPPPPVSAPANHLERMDFEIARRLQEEEDRSFERARLHERIMEARQRHRAQIMHPSLITLDLLDNIFLQRREPNTARHIMLNYMNRDFTDADYELLLQLDENVPKKTAADTVKTIKTFKATKEHVGSNCVVCMCDVEEGADRKSVV